YHDTYTGAPSTGAAWEGPIGTERVRRGGSFYSTDHSLRTTARAKGDPDGLYFIAGFRCAR
ncbi:MAG: SUMF1/EgtB/PvdO family nonheme iron enzyme, partial [Deltaproteobacteria bacterium]|nr:SUMF1/EgtB/PvdO family nonheme iron enzyme [Deltaproteobacteria bacterium]